ncbi:UTP--glucose-1-phosphate uridylyltransferase GalU [Noviherbaspirillum galbum]|uniref:UTP--glucose-1-phosphate uridylyltransferase n=1 Tax=Noviherbaspirillum galbum TaxID=2709383 RepID=A0A6B3SPX7_9BURK|nr:UTP--glucose-1-phosphate uridylyltransferase GalU [Noviherbaspirillum galbum]NEX59779.1 UTP--glucose-1-phosphate uridylyltransferase GalU [Noviherbaspirillum galbum]
MTTITKAVFPVAGLGTRFLPATKAQPKEMLPVVDKPLIQYAVEEAVAAGITEMVFITGRNKRAIEDHFDTAQELETELESAGKHALLETLRSTVPKGIHCIFIRQPAPLGLGHAVLCARPVVGDHPFAVLLADDMMDVDEGTKPVLAQMTDIYAREQASILAVNDVPRAETRQYGVVSATPFKDRLEKVNGIVEKPAPEDAPSTLAVVGRYVLDARIFDHLAKIGRGAGGEIQLTDGIAALMQEKPVLAYRYEGRRFDCGSKLGYLKATIAMARKHPELGAAFNRYLAELS